MSAIPQSQEGALADPDEHSAANHRAADTDSDAQDQPGAERSGASGRSDAVDRVDQLSRRLLGKYRDRICAELTLPAREAQTVPLPPELLPQLRRALAARGVQRLYSHQSEAWQAASRGEHYVVVTPTASGKTLCYNLPVLQAVCAGEGKALYLFPTKALAQDQVAELLELNRAGELGVRAYTFDGDTPGDARKAVRTRGDIVVSNPDMLHQAILPHHTKWAQFFENLRYVVIDEMHTYRGVFGSHVANLIRRLQRIWRSTVPGRSSCSARRPSPTRLSWPVACWVPMSVQSRAAAHRRASADCCCGTRR